MVIVVSGLLAGGAIGQERDQERGQERQAAQRRPVVVGRSKVATQYGIVAASQPLAARAGVQVLERGGNSQGHDTIYLSVIDRDGNIVSLIQSLYVTFGSGLAVPGTGIMLHNRGALFTLEHCNTLVAGIAERQRVESRRGARPREAAACGGGAPQAMRNVPHAR